MNNSIADKEELALRLVHGLQSQDKLIVESVLENKDESTIRSIIKRIPIEYITVFLHQLQSLLYTKEKKNLNSLIWLEQLLILRSTFLRTLPNLHAELNPLMELLSVRIDVLERLYKLKGRLNLMISQTKPISKTERLTFQEAKIQYESSSSSEEENEEESDDMEDLLYGNKNDEDEEEDYQSANEDVDVESEEDSSDSSDLDDDDDNNEDVDMKSGKESDDEED